MKRKQQKVDGELQVLCLQPVEHPSFHSCPNKTSETVQHSQQNLFICEQTSSSVVQITIAYCTTLGGVFCSTDISFVNTRVLPLSNKACSGLLTTKGSRRGQAGKEKQTKNMNE